MKKTILLLTFIIVFSVSVFASCPADMVGTGTEENPCQIQNWTQLDAIRDGLTLNYILMNDLDSQTEGYDGLGNNWQGISNNFEGSFNGQGYTISDLIGSAGLFSQNMWGNISNLGLINVNITSNSKVGSFTNNLQGIINNSYATGNIINTGERTGGLVAVMQTGKIINSYSEVNVVYQGTDEFRYIGGLVAEVQPELSYEHFIVDSYATGNVTGHDMVGGLVGVLITTSSGTFPRFIRVSNSYATGNVTGTGTYIGGLVGAIYLLNTNDNLSLSIWDSYSTGYVNGNDSVGGLVGYLHNPGAVINNSYTISNVSGNTNIGGLVGSNLAGTISNSFWNTDIYSPDNGLGTGKTTSEMKTFSTYTNAGWNISVLPLSDHIWFSTSNYPTLSNEVNFITYDLPSGYTLHDSSGEVGSGYHTSEKTLFIKKDSKNVVEFNIAKDINLSGIGVNKQGSKTVVSGFSQIPEIMGSHSLYVEKSDLYHDWVYICPDATSIEEVSASCTNVVSVPCNGVTYGRYSCIGVGDHYKVTGLRGSGAGQGEDSLGGGGPIPEFTTVGMILAIMIIGIFSMFIIKKKK
jgi:hypothetical protein